MTDLLATLGAALVILGLPAAAAVVWASRVVPERVADGPARWAVGYGGAGVSCLALWIGTSVAGLSALSAVASVAIGSAILLLAPAPPGVTPSERPSRARGLLAIALLSAIVVGTPFLVDGLERADGIHRVALTDWEKHVVVATGIAGAETFPPPHPYLHADPDPKYYFGFHLIAGAIQVTAGHRGDVMVIMLALTLLTAAATPAVVYVVGRDLGSARSALLAAAGASLLVGFDLLVVLVDSIRNLVAGWPVGIDFAALRSIMPSTHLDYWLHNVDRQFSAPVVSTMWAPHQTMAALLALVAFYLLSPARGESRNGPRTWLLPALLIAALPATSAYVAFGLAAGLAGSVAAEAWRQRAAPWRGPTLGRWAGPGLVGALLAVPILPALSGGSSSGLVIATSAAGGWSNGALFTALLGSGWLAGLLDTPAVYLVDFGLLGALGIAEIFRRRRGHGSDASRQTAAVALTIMAVVVIVRPPVGIGNNLYARALLLSWLLLAPFAAQAVLRSRRRTGIVLAAAICAMGTGYAVLGYVLEGALFWPATPQQVEAIGFVNRSIEPGDLVVIEPERYSVNVGIRLRRPLVYANGRLAHLFGSTAEETARAEDLIHEGYGATDPAAAARAFDALGARAIMVPSDPMPAWALPPCFERAYANIEWMVVRRTAFSCERP